MPVKQRRRMAIARWIPVDPGGERFWGLLFADTCQKQLLLWFGFQRTRGLMEEQQVANVGEDAKRAYMALGDGTKNVHFVRTRHTCNTRSSRGNFAWFSSPFHARSDTRIFILSPGSVEIQGEAWWAAANRARLGTAGVAGFLV